jgi:hypothetical protein
MKKWLSVYRPELIFYHYIEHVKDTDPKKASFYLAAYEKFIAGSTDSGVLEIIVKVREWFNKHECIDLHGCSNRPRCICNPSMIVKAIGGHINWVLMKAFK